jgi:hypothetical protein
MVKLDLSTVAAKQDEYAKQSPVLLMDDEALIGKAKASQGNHSKVLTKDNLLGLPKKQNRSTVQLGARVTPEVFEQLKNLSSHTGVPVNRIVQRFIKQCLAEYGEELKKPAAV